MLITLIQRIPMREFLIAAGIIYGGVYLYSVYVAIVLPGTLAYVPFFQISMLIGIIGIAGTYFLNGLTPPYSLPESFFVLLAIVIPIFQTCAPYWPWIAPVALGLLFTQGYRTTVQLKALKENLWEQDMHEANAALRFDSQNAAAAWRKGELYESKKMYSLAMQHYHESQRLSGLRNENLLNEAEARVHKALWKQIAAEELRKKTSWIWKGFGSLRRAWIYSLILLLPLLVNRQWSCFVTVYCVWLFAAWCLQSINEQFCNSH